MVTGHIVLIKRFRFFAEPKNEIQEQRCNLMERAKSSKHLKRNRHPAPRVKSIEDAVVLSIRYTIYLAVQFWMGQYLSVRTCTNRSLVLPCGNSL